MSNPRNLSSFTLIVTFVCLSLIGVVLVPLLPVKLAPSRTLPGLTVSFSMPGNSSRVIEASCYQILELFHTVRDTGCQIRVYIIIIFDGIR